MAKFDYTYNAVGTIATWTQQADSSTAVVNTLSYDGADQLTSAVQSGGGIASNAYAYDPAGNRLSETTGSGTTAGQFNNLNQLTALGTTTATTVAGHTNLAASSVTVNAIPATITSSTNFSASVPLPTGTNVVSIVAQPTSGIAITQREQIVTTGTAPTALAYDANGNTLTDEKGNTYKWDALNRLTAIIYPGGTHTEFTYDGLSRRIQIVERAGTTVGSGTVASTKNYLWIGSEIAEERDASNAVQKRFFPQGEQQSGTSYYYTRDHLGSVREMCSSTGTITSRMAYDPYGRTTTVSGTILPTKQYAGYYYHATSGFALTMYRAYDANTGRWLSRDPAGISGGMNLYGYVGDDPVLAVDSLGLKPTKDSGAASLQALLPTMQAMCDCCVDKSKVGQCKKDAEAIVAALVSLWNNNFGNGPYGPGGDPVGGFFCWDWASGFSNAAGSVNSTIWATSIREFDAPTQPNGTTPVHFATRIYIKGGKKPGGCEVTVDDGFFDNGMTHTPPWPSRTDYQEQNGAPNFNRVPNGHQL